MMCTLVLNGGRLKILALYGAHPLIVIVPQATLTFGQCALGFAQVKAAGLVEAVAKLMPQIIIALCAKN